MRLAEALGAYKPGDHLTLRGERVHLGLEVDILENTEWAIEREEHTVGGIADQLDRLRRRVGSAGLMDDIARLAEKLRIIEAEREARQREAEAVGPRLSNALANERKGGE